MPPNPPNGTIHLADEGLSPGDDITPYLNEFWEPGNHVVIPGGEYDYNGDAGALSITTSQDAWLEGDGEVVLNNAYDSVWGLELDNGAYVRVQNITIGDQLDERIKTWTYTTDTVLELVNVNIVGNPGTGEAGIYGAGDGDNVGTLRFINCHVENFNDGLYMSSMFEGHSEDGQAVVEVYGGLYRNCTSGNVRVGGHDSKVMHVTSVTENPPSGIANSKPLKIREAGLNQTVKDCDFYADSEAGDCVLVTNGKFEGNRDTSVWMENVRMYSDTGDDYVNANDPGSLDIEGHTIHLSGPLADDYDADGHRSDTLEGSGPWTNLLIGSEATQPRKRKRWVDPETLVPLTGGGGGGGSDRPNYEVGVHTFSSSDPEGRTGVVYEFVVDGPVTAGPDLELQDNDSITERADGTTLVEGTTGGGFSDDFIAHGQITSVTVDTHPDETSGEHILTLNGNEVTSSELIEQTSPNDAPTAALSINPTNPLVGETVQFSASESSDPDGSIASYMWEFGDGGTASGENVSYTYSNPGTFTVTLTVEDDAGATASTTRDVTVSEPDPQAPTARMSFSPETPVAGETVSFDGSESSDADGSIVAYEWDFGDDTDAGSQTTHTFASAGEYTVSLTVIDNTGMADTAQATVSVQAPDPQEPGTGDVDRLLAAGILGGLLIAGVDREVDQAEPDGDTEA